MSVALSVLVPCLDEAQNLDALTSRVLAALDALARRGPAELVLVDDGSTDDSWPRMQRLAGTRVRIARHDRRLGIPAAWRTGLAHSTGRHVCGLDADLQYQPEEIGALWDTLDREGADFVQGARRRHGDEGLARLALSRGLNGLLNTVFRMRSRDNKSAFFLCERRHLEALLGYRQKYHHWQCYLGVAAHAHGLRTAEVDATFVARARGSSAFGALPLKATAEVVLDLVPAVREYLLTARGTDPRA